MFGIVKTTHAPTGVEHCCYCNILSPTSKSLVVAGTSQIHVYKIVPNDSIADALTIQGRTAEKTSETPQKKTRLECVMSLALFGSVASMQSVRLPWQTRDSLLLAFKDAKMSVVEYDPASHDLKTLSLHYFEEEEFKGGLYWNVREPVIRIDPDKRCAIMLIYGSHLVVFPFRRDASVEEGSTLSRSPISSSYVIECSAIDPRLRNIVDIQFLHGYYEPTLFILHEPLRTWSGRIPVRNDTCSIAAISLNMQEKVHPVIWSSENLPYDALKAMPVPKPIGGVLVFAATSLVYLNQSVPPYAVSLCSVTDSMTSFPMKPQEGTRMALDGASAAFLSLDQILISLRSGEIYILTLLIDNMKMVRGFNFDKAASSVLSTCVCVCEEKYLFLGSRLGNSLLLKYTAKNARNAGATTADEAPISKRRRTDAGEWTVGFDDFDDLDELEVYGSDVQDGAQIASYSFEVCDNIMNIGPCGRMNLGEPACLAEEFSHTVDPDLELVMTSGYGKNGALSVLQRSVRPQVVTTFQLPGCLDMWIVFGPVDSVEKDVESNQEGEQEQVPSISDSHSFLLLSREESTMILQTGDDIMELDHSGFSTQTSTVFAGNIGENRYILQVTPKGIRLLQGVKQLQLIPIDLGSPIVYATAADPYVVIMSEDGAIMLLQLKQDRLSVLRPQVDSITSRIRCLCLYKDVSGMFSLTAPEEAVPEALPNSNVMMDSASSVAVPNSSTADDEDELLYGETYVQQDGMATSPPREKSKQPSGHDSALHHRRAVKTTHWVILYREDGMLQIYSIPDFKVCYSVKNFVYGHRVLQDYVDSLEPEETIRNLPVEEVKELLMVGFGDDGRRPHLLARVDEDLLVYEAFPFYNKNQSSRLQLRFKKLQHNLILREKRSRMKRKRDDIEEDDGMKTQFSRTLLRPFENIAGYSGVFVAGYYPHWLFASNKGHVRFHPMGIDGVVTSFSPFHNVNCPRGFLYFNRQGDMRICVLPTHLAYDVAAWPVRKVQLRCTPHFATYHPESKNYVVVTSQLETCNKIPKIVNDEREFEAVDKGDRFVYPIIERFALQLFSPVNWEPIPGTRIDMEDYEHITCCSTVSLKSEGTLSGLQGYIALGTNCCYSEDITSRGRIILFDIIEVVPEPGQPLTKNKIKVLYDKEQKGPVTALNHVEGFLITAIGQKIYIWQLKDNDLVGVSFIDTEVYIHQLTTIKNIILAADLQKSIAVLRYQVEHRVISMVSREPRPLEVYGTAFVVDNTQLGFLVSDRERNFIIYAYNPEAPETRGGSLLQRKADFNLGSQVTTFSRVRCKLTDPSTEKKASGIVEKRHVTCYATLDGGLGYVLPLPERVYRRLWTLQQLLVTNLQHSAGLNPKVYRNVQSQRRMLVNSVHNMIDGDLVWKFLYMSLTEQTAITKRIGTTIDQVVDDLLDIDRMTAHF